MKIYCSPQSDSCKKAQSTESRVYESQDSHTISPIGREMNVPPCVWCPEFGRLGLDAVTLIEI